MAGGFHAARGPKFARVSWHSTRRPVPGQSRVFPTGAILAIGRSANNVIILDDDSVSRQHAYLEIGDGTAMFQDLDSKNGSRLDGMRRITRIDWRPGERISIGEYTFEIDFVAVADTAPLPRDWGDSEPASAPAVVGSFDNNPYLVRAGGAQHLMESWRRTLRRSDDEIEVLARASGGTVELRRP